MKPQKLILLLSLCVILSFIGGGMGAKFYLENFWSPPQPQIKYHPQTPQESAIIAVVKNSLPSVVSIVVKSKHPIFEEFPFFFEEEKSGGTGFIVSEDGMILTNKHVIDFEGAKIKVITQDGKEYKAKILAKDPFQDLAILKIEKKGKKFKPLPLGDSDKLQPGQTVIAIGYALGEFPNSVSVGVVSGLSRRIVAGGGGKTEVLEEVIQTDAAINPGNSGGPLLNLKGEVVGINVAKVEGGENIGFAIPINKAKKALQSIKTRGKIVYPFLGIRYILITKELKEKYNLPVDYGALIYGGEKDAVIPGSPAEKAGLKEGDIILEVDGKKITPQNSLAKMIMEKNPGDQVILKILRNKKILKKKVTLAERSG